MEHFVSFGQYAAGLRFSSQPHNKAFLAFQSWIVTSLSHLYQQNLWEYHNFVITLLEVI